MAFERINSDPFALFANIPAELKAHRQWVLWRREERMGKMTKVPHAITGGRASSTNPATWASYDEVVAHYRAHRSRFDGIGFVVTEDDDYVGVDLDHCVDLVTREIDPAIVPIIVRLHSYIEVTPSATGLRIFVRGTLPPKGRKHGNVEMYSEGRFLTMTGDILVGAPTDIAERTAELAVIHEEVFGPQEPERPAPLPMPARYIAANDEEVIERAMNAVNGERFRALWLGNRTGYASDSESDMALASHLVYWCGGDTEWAKDLFRKSGLYRSKWDERRTKDGRTYGDITVAKSLQGVAVVTQKESDRLPKGAFYGGVAI